MKNQQSSTIECDWCNESDFDALVAAPHNHILLFENDYVRVIDTRVEPGHTIPLHTHPWPCTFVILEPSDFVRRDADGRVIQDTRNAEEIPVETTLWFEPSPPYSVENVGKTELRAISVEIKTGR